MPVPDHLATFIDLNVSGKVFLFCRERGLLSPGRIALYTRAVRCAVSALVEQRGATAQEIDGLIQEQLGLLGEALKTQHSRPPPRLQPTPSEEPEPEVPEQAQKSPGRGLRDGSRAMGESRSMEQKLEDARQPVRELLQTECVRLGLITLDRAKALCRQMAGKDKERAEEEIVIELRDNLLTQLRAFMRKNKGGPWTSPKQQEELRIDIVATRSVQSVIRLAHHVLEEREGWEKDHSKGFFRSILGYKIKDSLDR